MDLLNQVIWRAGELSREALKEAMRFKDRKHFQDRFIKPALKLGLIAMTRPDSPRSVLQRYTLTALGERIAHEHQGLS